MRAVGVTVPGMILGSAELAVSPPDLAVSPAELAVPPAQVTRVGGVGLCARPGALGEDMVLGIV